MNQKFILFNRNMNDPVFIDANEIVGVWIETSGKKSKVNVDTKADAPYELGAYTFNEVMEAIWLREKYTKVVDKASGDGGTYRESTTPLIMEYK